MITVFTLILYAATNSLSDTDSVALTSVPNIQTLQKCQQAGEAAASMANASYKNIKYICIPTIKD